MDQQSSRLHQLFNQYLNNDITHDEFSEFWTLLNDVDNVSWLTPALKRLWEQSAALTAKIDDVSWEEKMSRLRSIIDGHSPVIHSAKRARRLWWAAAAAVVAGITVSIFMLTSTQRTLSTTAQHDRVTPVVTDVAAGGNKAVLLLADGTTINLDSAKNGMLTTQANTRIIKQQNGRLEYVFSGGSTANETFNTLSTPRGGQYQLALPDGTEVWLNAQSSITYPTAFASDRRIVYITGEAYFEVSKDKSKPFVVKARQKNSIAPHTSEMDIEVLGTTFNVNTYQDEQIKKTTLLEGSVKIISGNSTEFLEPGQQAQITSPGIVRIARNVDTESSVAWKNGNFQFEDADITTIMRQLSRWYDVDVEYQANVTKHFGGIISRQVNLSRVLHLLAQTGAVKFVIEQKKIIVKT